MLTLLWEHVYVIMISNRLLLFPILVDMFGGARGVMVIVVGNGHGDTSSNPGRD